MITLVPEVRYPNKWENIILINENWAVWGTRRDGERFIFLPVWLGFRRDFSGERKKWTSGTQSRVWLYSFNVE